MSATGEGVNFTGDTVSLVTKYEPDLVARCRVAENEEQKAGATKLAIAVGTDRGMNLTCSKALCASEDGAEDTALCTSWATCSG